MTDIEAAFVSYLREAVETEAVAERSDAVHYPLLAVTATEKASVLLCGGALAERSYAVTIQAADHRRREGASALLEKVSLALLRGVPFREAGGQQRCLHPTEVQTQGDTLRCTVSLCVKLPEPPQGGGAAEECMERLDVSFA